MTTFGRKDLGDTCDTLSCYGGHMCKVITKSDKGRGRVMLRKWSFYLTLTLGKIRGHLCQVI